MANLREALAATGYASLEWNPDWERSIDRVAASGKVDSLGLSLWKARYMLEVDAYHDARSRLLGRYLKRWPRTPPWFTAKIIDQCLHEYLAPFCKTCRGAKEMIIEQKRVVCATCDGAGVRRYSDSDRARSMRVSFDLAQKNATKIETVNGEIAWMDGEVNNVLVHELEREGVDTKAFLRSIRFQQEQERSPVAASS